MKKSIEITGLSSAVDIVRGSITKPQQTASLIKRISDYFNNSDDESTLYLSYPLTANSDEKITLDAMLLSKKKRDGSYSLW